MNKILDFNTSKVAIIQPMKKHNNICLSIIIALFVMMIPAGSFAQSKEQELKNYLNMASWQACTYEKSIDYLNKALLLAQEDQNLSKYVSKINKELKSIQQRPANVLLERIKYLVTHDAVFIKIMATNNKTLYSILMNTTIRPQDENKAMYSIILGIGLTYAVFCENELGTKPGLSDLLFGTPRNSYYDSLLYQAELTLAYMRENYINMYESLIDPLESGLLEVETGLVISCPKIKEMDFVDFMVDVYPLPLMLTDVTDQYIFGGLAMKLVPEQELKNLNDPKLLESMDLLESKLEILNKIRKL